MRLFLARFVLALTPFVFAVSLGVAAPAAAQDGSAVCEPDPSCKRVCRVKARALFAECLDAGHEHSECVKRQHRLKRACIATECDPQPNCEERCALHGKRLLQRCIEAGGASDRCEEEARRATRACVEENCRDCLCPQNYDPVCGKDGRTYPNACTADCAGAEIKHEGACEPACLPLPCDVFCEFGHKIGRDGCPTCECNPPPGCRSNDDCRDDQVCRPICSLRPCRSDRPDDCPVCVGVCVPACGRNEICPAPFDSVFNSSPSSNLELSR